jgi:hypothetical protein
MCKNSNGMLTIEHYQNLGKSTPVKLDGSNPAIGYSNIKTSLIDNIMTCSFTRAKKSGKLFSQFSNYFDLSKPFHIITASGPMIDGNIF